MVKKEKIRDKTPKHHSWCGLRAKTFFQSVRERSAKEGGKSVVIGACLPGTSWSAHPRSRCELKSLRACRRSLSGTRRSWLLPSPSPTAAFDPDPPDA